MPVIDFKDLDDYDAAIEFLVGKGVSFHTLPPQRVVVRRGDLQALQEANIVRGSVSKAVRSSAKTTRSSSKPKAGGTS